MKGFSLIELLVVVAIISVLAAIAVPTYKVYVTKTAISSATGYMYQAKQLLVDGYEKTGNYETNCGAGSGSATLYSPNNAYIQTVSCWVYTSVSPYSHIYAIIYVSFQPNVIPGDTAGQQQLLLIVYPERNGVVQSACGTYSSGVNSIPLQYLPQGCDQYVYSTSGTILYFPPGLP